jgi:hypothetical protein
MARKVQKNIRVDEGVLQEFVKIADRKKEHHNVEIEELMKQYIARDGQLLFDDLYAPRISHAVKTAVDEQINRIMKVLYNINVDVTAALYSAPTFHQQSVKGLEDVIESFLNPQLLDQQRTSISANYSLAQNGQKSVDHLRKIAHSDIQKRRTKKESQESS